MAGCAACGRPVAVSRAHCLYCGAELPKASLAAEFARVDAEPAARRETEGATAEPEALKPRFLLVLEADGADAGALARGLRLSPYEAALRARRGGYQLLKVLEPDSARAEAAQLGSEGLRTFLLPEAEVREARTPRLALSGRVENGALLLQLEEGSTRILAGGLLLVVKGPIAREYQIPVDMPQTRRGLRRVRAAGLEGGHLFHLHLRDQPRPVEIDPGAFDFGTGARGTSSLGNVQALVEAVATGARVDDAFRRLPPALAPASAARGPLAAAEALRATTGERSLVLDNTLQFREHSAWRGTLERQLA